MSAALSILHAARDAADSPALRIAQRVYSFAELADLTRERIAELRSHPRDGTPCVVVAENSLAVVVTLYALLETRIPVVLLHPRLTEAERAERLRAIAAADRVRERDAAAVLFTSGTTGKPRGAVITHRAFVASASASAANLGWSEDDCWLLCMPLAHVGGLSILTRCLLARRCVALAARLDAGDFPSLLEEQQITLASLVPTMLARVLDRHPHWMPPQRLRAILLGGAAATSRLLERSAERQVPVTVTYGLTEACSQVTTTRYETRFAPLGEGSGEPLPGTEVQIADGRIQVRGRTMMAGYWNEPPLEEGAWFDTGDLGAMDQCGRLHVQARRSDLIVTGGENVYPVEVEDVLEGFPGIAGAAVFGVPDDEWGEVVATALVPAGEPPPDSALIEYLNTRLAPHKRPRRICYAKALPLNAAGKLDRAALAQFTGQLRPLVSTDEDLEPRRTRRTRRTQRKSTSK